MVRTPECSSPNLGFLSHLQNAVGLHWSEQMGSRSFAAQWCYSPLCLNLTEDLGTGDGRVCASVIIASDLPSLPSLAQSCCALFFPIGIGAQSHLAPAGNKRTQTAVRGEQHPHPLSLLHPDAALITTTYTGTTKHPQVRALPELKAVPHPTVQP